MLLSINSWICIQRKDGYGLKILLKVNSQNNEENNFVHSRDTNKGRLKLSFRMVVAISRTVVALSTVPSKKFTAVKA